MFNISKKTQEKHLNIARQDEIRARAAKELLDNKEFKESVNMIKQRFIDDMINCSTDFSPKAVRKQILRQVHIKCLDAIMNQIVLTIKEGEFSSKTANKMLKDYTSFSL